MPEHRVASGDPDDESRLLEMTAPARDLDLDTAVPCPLSAGSATMHGYATPHYTGPNRSSDRGRRAFIFSFAHPNALASISGDRGDWKSSSTAT
jgi:ectoine hydroxylase-related dioxygenase (phytanoyl-CoA dioxygenase family)